MERGSVRRLVVVSVIGCIVSGGAELGHFGGGAGRAHAQSQAKGAIKPEAEVRFRRGLEYYKIREFEAAIAEFEAAYAIDPRPEILFSQAQAERLSGDCASAVVLYRQFLTTDPPAVHAEAARASLDKCEVALRSGPPGAERERASGGDAKKPAPPSDEKPSGPGNEPRDAAPGAGGEDSAPPWAGAGESDDGAASSRATPGPERGTPRPRRRFWQDPIGDGLAVAGVAALAVGTVYFFRSSADAADAASAPTWDQHQALLDRAESGRTIAWIGLGAGVALAVGAGLRWGLAGESRGEAAPAAPAIEVSAQVSPSGAGLILGGRF
jgi:tetratricopeptide (TPR) repeat protein